MCNSSFARILGMKSTTKAEPRKKSEQPSLDVTKGSSGFARILKDNQPMILHGNCAHATRMGGLFRNV